MLNNGLIKIYFGEGKGKSMASLGRAMICASEGREVFVVQFLKGRMDGNLEYLQRLEPEMKIFRFEKADGYFENLNEEEKKDEIQNILNGLNFVHKVLSIGECDVLVLDEVLGLVDLEIISVEDLIRLIERKSESVELIMTGRNLPDHLMDYADYVSRMEIIKSDQLSV